MMRWTPDLQKWVQPLANSIRMGGIWEASQRQPKSRYTELMFLLLSFYGCEMWTTYQRHIKKLNHLYMTCLRKILSITWQKHFPDTDVLTWASLPSDYIILMQSQLRWAGHVVRVKDHCLLKKLLYGELSQGMPSKGDQKRHFKDTLKV